MSTPKISTTLVLSLMMVAVPAMGVPHQEMLQDTLKAILVTLGTLAAYGAFFWCRRTTGTPRLEHPVLLLPLGLTLFAATSVVWGHVYLGAVETIRWLVFTALVWLGLNTLTRQNTPTLIGGIHLGVTAASVWAALQFWFNFDIFPQGPNPASTFVNRNFFAEYAVSVIPFSLFLITREKRTAWLAALTLSTGLNLTALMMTGTRSALIGLLILLIPLTVIMMRYRAQLAISHWPIKTRLGVPLLMALTVLALGLIPTGNRQLMQEAHGQTALSRALGRTLSVAQASEYSVGSFSVRAQMWQATARMAADHPVWGVGAGAWEVHAPRYQEAGTPLETDFYAHNDFLQLIAENGIVGWAFIVGLLIYLAISATKTWRNQTHEGQLDAPIRGFTLASLLVFFVVSCAGFPWRLSAHGALFALSLALLAASDHRLGYWIRRDPSTNRTWGLRHVQRMRWVVLGLTGAAMTVTYQATLAEQKLVRSVQLALTVSESGQPTHPHWKSTKADLLRLVHEGVAINPHYRKLTPLVADELASWGDWENAVWIWESVLSSRPYVLAIIANISRGYLHLGNTSQSLDYLERATQLQPTAPAVHALQVLLLTRMGDYGPAAAIATPLLQQPTTDYDLVYAAYLCAIQSKNWALATRALEIRINHWPQEAADGWMKLGDLFSQADVLDEGKALQSYRAALEATPQDLRPAAWARIPAHYKAQFAQLNPSN